MTLHELAVKYGSDKAEHGYCDFYECWLPVRESPIKILEIGVKEGASLKMWAEWFPNAEIHGLDLFEENDIKEVGVNVYDVAAPGQIIKLHKGNQCDWQLLEQLRKEKFDVIIDDGSHNARDQMITFFGLFAGNFQQYYIEDLHCNREEFYRQGLPLIMTASRFLRPYIWSTDATGNILSIH